MKHLFFLTLATLSQLAVFSQDHLLPKDYQLIKAVEGDLDKDGVREKAAVYNITDTMDEIEGYAREVVVFKMTKGEWAIWFRSRQVVGGSKDGGMMGDPFGDMEIKNGLLVIDQSGGSSWKWGHTDKYRYQNNALELIGYSSSAGKLCEYWVNVDYNLSTGTLVYSKEYEKCDEGGEVQKVYKKEQETFKFKPAQKVTFENRVNPEVKIVTPKYKEEIYL